MPDAPGYLEPYENAVREQGATWGAQLWKSPEAQSARFAVACELAGIGPGGGVRTIADIGCGRADLAAFIAEKGFVRGPYLGVEGVPELAQAARGRAAESGWPDCTILQGDFVADADLPARLVREHGVDAFVFSGALNTLEQDAAIETLARFWNAISGRGVLVFNFLPTKRDPLPPAPGDPARRFDAEAALAWALAQHPSVRYRRDYLGDHDATIAIGSTSA
ncbi:MAG: class I SAM-dependent methyltransferase [Phycisphaerales bacterium]